MMYKLQDVIFMKTNMDERTVELYYRGKTSTYFNSENDVVVEKGSFMDFFTYFNSLSIEKWKVYTYASVFYLFITAKGKFRINLFGHYVEENGFIGKEYLGSYVVENYNLEEVCFEIPTETRCGVISFSLEALTNVAVNSCYYATDIDNNCVSDVFISLVTTTFKKENYINKNITLLNKYILTNEEFKDHFCWKIVDNGSTLDEYEVGGIEIVHNKNVGGAGGFSKGMILSLRMKKKPTHILFMDDDVNFSPESFIRTYRLLSILRPKYKDYFISGAMLNMDAPNIQHENTGVLMEDGYCVPINTGFDLCQWDKVVLNDVIKEYRHQYAAWWFCCIPTTVANMSNLPMPLFVRGDDIEYSLRNKAKIITMNGISIWHQSFGGRFDMVTEYYQSKRNELVVYSSKEELEEIDTFGFIEKIFWQELYKFNYVGAELLIDAVEDYLKGPEWLFSINMFEEIKKRKNRILPAKKITDEIRMKIDYGNLYSYEPISKWKKILYDYTFNGQARLPQFMLSKREGIIPYSGVYLPGKQLLTSNNYVIDPINDVYYEYSKNVKMFKKVRARFLHVKEKYIKENINCRKMYKEALERVSTVIFWDEYLE